MQRDPQAGGNVPAHGGEALVGLAPGLDRIAPFRIEDWARMPACHLGPDRLWALVERHRATVLGVSPTLVRALMKHGAEPVQRHDLSSLRILGSTGEPWNPESWRWLFERAGGSRLPIINYSGGTEVSGGLVAGNVLTPLKPCSFAGPPPGMR